MNILIFLNEKLASVEPGNKFCGEQDNIEWSAITLQICSKQTWHCKRFGI